MHNLETGHAPGPSFAAALIDSPFNLTAASVQHTLCDNVATAATPAHVYHSLRIFD